MNLAPISPLATVARWIVASSGQPLSAHRRATKRVPIGRLYESLQRHCAAADWDCPTRDQLSRCLGQLGLRNAGRGWYVTREWKDWLMCTQRQVRRKRGRQPGMSVVTPAAYVSRDVP